MLQTGKTYQSIIIKSTTGKILVDRKVTIHCKVKDQPYLFGTHNAGNTNWPIGQWYNPQTGQTAEGEPGITNHTPLK